MVDMRSTTATLLILVLIETLFVLSAGAVPTTWNRTGESRSIEHKGSLKDAPISHHILPQVVQFYQPRLTATPRPSTRHQHHRREPLPEPIRQGPEFLRGVNVGGWLVLESWITPELFDGTGAVDQWTFDQTDGANSKLEDHWENFFTENDVSKLASYGINALRIPIGFWAYETYGTPYIQGADAYLARAIQWAQSYGMKVWIDLHGAPGSQNGLDHSGHAGELNWHEPMNLARTISVLEKIAEKYGSLKYADVVHAIELVNEPVSDDYHELWITKGWTEVAYEAVRSSLENKKVHIVMQDAYMGSEDWIDVVNDAVDRLNRYPSRHRSDFAIDSHMYQVFEPEDLEMTQPEHIKKVCRWANDFFQARVHHVPVFAGEWSGATRICVNPDGSTLAGEVCDIDGCQCETNVPVEQWKAPLIEQVRLYVEAQLDVWEAHTRGYFYWNYKGTGAWDFMSGIERGFIPNPVTSRKYPGQCDFHWYQT